MATSGTHFDLVVIGGGASGSIVAGGAVKRGAKVAMIERWKVGGTCLNVGCDPTKTLVRSAEVLHLARTADRYGVHVRDARADWPAVIRRVEEVIDTIRGGDGDQNVRDSGVALYKEHARFRSPHQIEIGGQLLTADKVVIATGAAEEVPPIEGLREVGFITNVEAVALPTLPRSLAIIGGGVVAVEFAQIFARFGVEVTILASQPHLLPKEDAALTAPLEEVLRREGVRIETDVRVSRAWSETGLKSVAGQRDGRLVEAQAEELLVAVGRAPVVDRLNLDAAGVEYTDDGITVDDTLQTSAGHIWAVGDVTGVYPFTHVADYQARLAEHNAMSGEQPRRADYQVVPWVTFTDPELARVGSTEAEARAAGHEVVCAVVQLRKMPRAITAGERDGLVKLVADRTTGRLLGGHILAARGGELIAEVALAMRHDLPVAAIAETIHPYPTLSEAVFWTAYQLAKP